MICRAARPDPCSLLFGCAIVSLWSGDDFTWLGRLKEDPG